MSRITDIAKTMKTWWNEDDDLFVQRALDEIIRIDQEQSPTIEPKRGEWIRIYSRPNVYKYLGWTCNQCEYRTTEEYAPQYFKYCPNCGADMRGKDDE